MSLIRRKTGLVGRKLQTLRKIVLRRDNYKCVLCDNKLILEVHHIIPVSVAPHMAFWPSNCKTLCEECHKIVERGMKNGE